MIVSFISLGCDKNRVNTEQMMALCLQSGMTVQEDCNGSDVVVVNTCGFIDSAKLEAIETILSVAELKAAGRVGKILVTGCLSQRYQAELLKELPEVFQQIAAEESPERAVCDYVSGMTDSYAMEVYSALYIPVAWSIK